MKWNLNDLPVFVAVMESQGITAAAQKLGLQKSSVSRAITRLETALALRLLERNSRHIRPTAEGQALYAQLKPTLTQLDGIAHTLTCCHLKGELNIALTLAFSREIFSPFIASFTKRHPDITLNIRTLANRLSLFDDQLDLAIQLGSLAPSGFYARRLHQITLCWMISPDYLQQHPELVDAPLTELIKHVRFCHDQDNYPERFYVLDSEGKELDITFPKASKLEDVLMVREAVKQGAGVALLPDIYCQRYIERGDLIRVSPSIAVIPAVEMYAVYPSCSSMSPRLKTMLAFLDEIIANYTRGHCH